MKFAGTIVVAAVVVVMGAGSVGYLYNYRLSPLARLASGIEEGDPFSEVHNKFVAYYEHRQMGGGIDFTARESASGRWTSDVTVKASGLYLSDRGLFDDIRLTVQFNDNGRVEHIRLVGD